ncbi:Uncharacterised protein [Acinetobacter calcoaceticus]|uniref:Uncharacterized protein n=1 Tax=Acinetobacter calcoaceticus TaxID=471 RepID=A0A446ZI06_ACICA|nr:Uncharacterised protein [Acinetobacter calcoaceticus]
MNKASIARLGEKGDVLFSIEKLNYKLVINLI